MRVLCHLEELPPDHTCGDTESSSISLSLRKRIFIIGDIDRHFFPVKFFITDNIDELARELHPVHRRTNRIEHFSPNHPEAIMRIREIDIRNHSCKNLSASENHLPKQWNIRMRILEKS